MRLVAEDVIDQCKTASLFAFELLGFLNTSVESIITKQKLFDSQVKDGGDRLCQTAFKLEGYIQSAKSHANDGNEQVLQELRA